jgi:hypothetical protein
VQKLFQAVEEARALLAEGAAAASRQQRKQLALAAKAGQPAVPQQQQRPQRRQRSQTPDHQQQQQASKPEQDAAVQVPAYPPPVREDMGRSSKQLLKWLKAAAADPMVRRDTQTQAAAETGTVCLRHSFMPCSQCSLVACVHAV